MYRFITTSLLAMMALTLMSAMCPAQENPTSMKEFKFELLPVDGHGETTVTQEGPSGFVLNLKNTAAHNYGIAMANFDFTATAQHKLAFRITGAPQNASTNLIVSLMYEEGGGKWQSRDAHLGKFSSSDPRTITSPGSETQGMPASLHSAQLSPASMRRRMPSPFCRACS